MVWSGLPWLLVAGAAVLTVPATVMGDRHTRYVRMVKTAVTGSLAIAVAIRVVGGFLGLSGVASAGTPTVSLGTTSNSVCAAILSPTPLTAFHYLILAGIVLTVIADWLLAPIDNSRSFIAGLSAFLVGYLLYGVALLSRVSISWGIGLAVYLPVAAVSVGQFVTLRRVPGELRLPVIVYVAVAAHLLAAGILNAVVPVVTTPIVAGLLVLGTVLIYLSDSLIAHNLFRAPMKHPELWIMPTYYTGQVAIVVAVLL